MSKLIIVADDFFKTEDNLFAFAECIQSWIGKLSNRAICEMVQVYKYGYRFIVDESKESCMVTDDHLMMNLVDDEGLSDEVFFELCKKGYIQKVTKQGAVWDYITQNDLDNVIDTRKFFLNYVMTCHPVLK